MQRLAVALNSVGSQPLAVLILFFACACWALSKPLGLSEIFPLQLLAVGATMLTHSVLPRTETSQPGPGADSTIQVTGSPVMQPSDPR